jgi:hypothetical protein
MPMPQVLNLNISVFNIKAHKLGPDFGLLGKISSLPGIKAHLICQFCFPTEVEEVEAELRQAVEIHHPNNPLTLEIIRYAEDRMVYSDSDSEMLERPILGVRAPLCTTVLNQSPDLVALVSILNLCLVPAEIINSRGQASPIELIIRYTFITD